MKPARSPRLALAFALALPAGLAMLACSVKAPPRTAWSLSGGTMPGQPRLDPAGLALGMTRFTAAPESRTTALTWRDTEGHLLHETADSWTDYPDRMLEEMAMARLVRAGKFRSVSAAPPQDGLDALLSCRLVEFGEWDSADSMETRVTLRWQLSRAGRGDSGMLGSGEASGHAPIAEKSVSAVVRAYGDASAQALDRLTEQVASAAAAGAAGARRP